MYVGSGSNQIVVNGLLPTSPAVQVTPARGTIGFAELNTITDTIYVNSLGTHAGEVNLTLTVSPPGVAYSFVPASVSLTATNKSVATKLSILPAAAVLPLGDNYTALVQASAAGGSTGYAPIRLLMRSAMFTSITKIGCNSSNQMDVSLSWQINGSSVSSLWIQDTATPAFPGRRD